MADTTDLLLAQVDRALADRSPQRLLSILAAFYPISPPDLLEQAINDYLSHAKGALEFEDTVAVLPGDFYPVRTLGELAKTGYLSSMVSLDLLWILDEYIASPVIATGMVGRVGEPTLFLSSTDNHFYKRYSPQDHPLVSFDILQLYKKHQENAENFVEDFDPEQAGKHKYPHLTVAAYEDFQYTIVARTIRLYLRALTDDVRSWRNPVELAEALYKVIYDSLTRSPHLDLDFFRFKHVKDLAEIFADDDEVPMRRRSLYKFIAQLPTLDQVKPDKLTVVKDIYKVLDEPVHKSTVSEPERKLASVLEFPQKMERKTCPLCESEMVRRSNRRTGAAFWGCSTFPKCRHTIAG